MKKEIPMEKISIKHDIGRFRQMLSYAVLRESVWGAIDVVTRDGGREGLLLVVDDYENPHNLVSSGVVFDCYEDALMELGGILDELNPELSPLGHR
tara:strand:+ start:274 stop:561 length:288 start_codon:yes stop_codon:yes gene_type:complete